MNLYDKASLIITPNAYKASKIYAVKPTSGAGDLTFSSAGQRFRRLVNGNWGTVAANEPRLHYQIGGGCPGVLLQNQYSNLNAQSQEISLWQDIGGTTVTPNATASILEGQQASRVTFDGLGTRIRRTIPFNIVSNNLFMGFLVFVKNDNFQAGEILNINLTNSTASPNDYALSVAVNLVAKTATFSLVGTAGTGRVGSAVFTSVVEEADGWIKIQAFGLSGSNNNSNVWNLQLTTTNLARSFFIGHALITAMSIPAMELTPIITSGSQITQALESAQKTAISGLLGQTEGSVFLDFVPTTNATDARFLSISNSGGAGGGWIGIFAASLGGGFRIYGDGFDVSIGSLVVGQRYKIAFSYKNGVATNIYINGVQFGPITANTTGKSYDLLQLANAPIGSRGTGIFYNSLLTTLALSNAELAALNDL